MQKNDIHQRQHKDLTMDQGNEKRNSEHETDQAPSPPGPPSQGVGARQGDPSPPSRGGGYLNTCTVLNFRPENHDGLDPRLAELHEMGMPRIWMRVAESVGVDAFLSMWRILDGDQSTRGENGLIQVQLREYRSYLRYQRNRYIEAMDSAGMSPREIQARLKLQLGENLTLRHISRIKKRA